MMTREELLGAAPPPAAVDVPVEQAAETEPAAVAVGADEPEDDVQSTDSFEAPVVIRKSSRDSAGRAAAPRKSMAAIEADSDALRSIHTPAATPAGVEEVRAYSARLQRDLSPAELVEFVELLRGYRQRTDPTPLQDFAADVANLFGNRRRHLISELRPYINDEHLDKFDEIVLAALAKRREEAGARASVDGGVPLDTRHALARMAVAEEKRRQTVRKSLRERSISGRSNELPPLADAASSDAEMSNADTIASLKAGPELPPRAYRKSVDLNGVPDDQVLDVIVKRASQRSQQHSAGEGTARSPTPPPPPAPPSALLLGAAAAKARALASEEDAARISSAVDGAASSPPRSPSPILLGRASDLDEEEQLVCLFEKKSKEI